MRAVHRVRVIHLLVYCICGATGRKAARPHDDCNSFPFFPQLFLFVSSPSATGASFEEEKKLNKKKKRWQINSTPFDLASFLQEQTT